MTPTLVSICDELGIRVVHPAQHRPFTPMQTAAGRTLEKILRDPRLGENHLRDVLTVLTESENNRNMIIAPVVKAVSRIMAANAMWYASDASKFLETMDRADLAGMYQRSKVSKHVVPAHHSIAAALLELLQDEFQPKEMERLV